MTGASDRRDLVCGLLVAGVGALTLTIGLQYDVGSLRRIGPGLFPMAIGTVLLGLGLAIAAFGSSGGEDEAAAEPVRPRAALLVLGAIGAFAVLIGTGGMVPAVFSAVLLSSLADPRFDLRASLGVAGVMSAMAVVVFIYGLGFQARPFGAY